MALSTLRLRQADPSLRQHREPLPAPQDLNEVIKLGRTLSKLRDVNRPALPTIKHVLPDIPHSSNPYSAPLPDIEADEAEEEDGGCSADVDLVCSVISDEGLKGWLKRSQIMLNIIYQWWWEGENSLDFLNWWMTVVTQDTRSDWFKLECGILLEEVTSSVDESAAVTEGQIMEYLLLVLHEHPKVFCSESEKCKLPDMIEILVSSDRRSYLKLLSDLKGQSGKNQEIMLSTRTFCIISLCYNVISFYKTLVGEKIEQSLSRPVSRAGSRPSGSRPAPSAGTQRSRPVSKMSIRSSPQTPSIDSRPSTAQNASRVEMHNIIRAFQAVQLGFLEVLEYLFSKDAVNPGVRDEQGRSLIFAATVYKQHAILNYLLTDVHPCPDVNQIADNGNTPLHAAVSTGNSLATNILLKAGADPHVFNPDSNGATPLHLATLHDHLDCVILLLGAGADPMNRMGLPADTSSIDLARSMDHSDILKLLIGAVPVRPDSKLYMGEVW